MPIPTATQVKAARALLGWSQRALAQRAGVALSTVADFERGFREPIQNNLHAIVKSFEKERITFSDDGTVRGTPPGHPPFLPKGNTPFRFIDETELRQWAATRDCQARLPELLTRLIRAEKGHEALLRFPSGDAISLHGWDGRCTVAAGSKYIPAGESGWELTAQAANIRKKADKVFNDRSQKPEDIVPVNSTFVFVTPLRFSGKAAWLNEKKAEGKWGDIRALDAVDLVHWIELNPAVGHWLAVLTGKLPLGLRQIEKVWEEWSLSTEWPISTDLVLAGRDEETTQALNWLYGEPAPITIQAESPEEAMAFLYAAIDRLPADYRLSYLARCLIATEPGQARALGHSATSLIIVLENADPGLARWLVGQGHHVYSVFGSEVGTPETVIRLSRALRIEIDAALKSMGLPDQEASEVARDMAGSLAIFRRLHPSVNARMVPEWASPLHAPTMIPALLAGAWDEAKPADRAVMEQLVHADYDSIVRSLTPWLTVPDSPLRKSGSVWKIASPRDALFRLAPYLTPQALEAYANVAVDVLGRPDPRFDMPKDQRWYAPIHGQMPEHSEFLRAGLSETLMALAIFGNQAGIADAAQRAAAIVSKLLTDADARRWWSVSRLLDLLAEAAPETFLSAVAASLDLNDPPVMVLFVEDETPLASGANHSHLLWALETLARSPKYISRAAHLLARLAALDTGGGRSGNRPANSLRNLFVLWMPQTYASLTERLGVLDAILRKHEPGVAWRLMCDLLPTSYDTMWPSARPRWRDFSEGRAEEEITTPLWIQSAEEVAKRLLEDVGTDRNRWVLLVDHLADLPPVYRRNAITLLGERVGQFDQRTRSAVWVAVRSLLHKHREFPDADWSLPDAELTPLDPIYEQLTPNDRDEQIAWLFVNGEVPLPHPPNGGWEAQEVQANLLRQQAVEKILGTQGDDAVFRFAHYVESPFSIGNAIASATITEERRETILVHCLKGDSQLVDVARGIVLGCLRSNDADWGYKLLDRALAESWTKDMVIVVALLIRESRRLWDRISVFGSDIENEYWRRIPSITAAGVPGEGLFAINKLMSVGRPRATVSVAARHGKEIPTATLVTILENAASEPLTDKRVDFDVSNFQYYLEHVLQALDKRSEVENSTIAQLEWAYCPILRRSQRSLSALHRELANDPAFFAEVIRIVYRPDPESGISEPESDSSENREAMFSRGYQLLNSWTQIPGQEGATINRDTLERWITEARRACAVIGRRKVCDRQIGSVFAYAVAEADGIWPPPPVRDIVDTLHSAEIEDGVMMGLIRKRGPTWRAMNDGGDQEREIAAQYRRFSQTLRIEWPQTAAMLERIAQFYENDARQHDQDVEKRDWS